MKGFEDVNHWLMGAGGKACSDVTVENGYMLHFGLGAGRLAATARQPERKIFEWEMGTFTAAWRVCDGRRVLCGSSQSKDYLKVCKAVKEIDFGSFEGVEIVSNFDVRLKFFGGVYVDLLSASGRDESTFYIVGPDGKDAVYNYRYGWRLTNRPEVAIE